MGDIKRFFLTKLFSRKLIVWIVGTVLLCFKVIDVNTWLILSCGYMGLNATLSAVNAIKTSKDAITTKKSALVVPQEISEEEKEGEA